METSLSEMKRKNKAGGGYFFDRGNAPIVSKQGNYLVARSGTSDGFVLWHFDEATGRMDFVDNPNGEYSWQPWKNKLACIEYAKRLNKQ